MEPPPSTRERRAPSLATRLASYTVAVLAVVGVLVARELTDREQERLLMAKQKAAVMVTELFAASVGPALDFKDEEGLRAGLAALRGNREVLQAAVVGGDAEQPIALALVEGGPPLTPQRARSVERAPLHLDVTEPVPGPEGQPIGATTVRFSLEGEARAYDEARRSILLATAGLGLTLALVLVLLVRRGVVAPLGRLTTAAGQLAAGALPRVDEGPRDEVGQLARAFNAMAVAIRDREARLAAATGRLQRVLDHTGQGILVFDQRGMLEAERSRTAEAIFGEALDRGASVLELLYPSSSSTAVEREAFEEWLSLLGEDDVTWEDVVDMAPRAVTLQGARGALELELGFRLVSRGGGEARVLLLATDVTEQRRFAAEVAARDREHDRQLAAMRRLVAGGGQLFVRFLEGARRRLEAVDDALGRGASGVQEVFQHVHTLKGEARVFDLASLEDELSAMEVILAELRISGRREQLLRDPETLARLRLGVSRSREQLARAEATFVAQSPIGDAILDQTTVSRRDVAELLTLARGRDDALGRVASRLAARPFGEVVGSLLEAVPRWAARAGKAVRVEIGGRDVLIEARAAEVLPGVLAHLARNAVAHGLEAPRDREAAGKPAEGVITLTAEPVRGGAVVTLSDDGPGLDAQALRARAEAAGIDAPLAELPFHPGLSTAEAGGALAGWGVGLPAARAELAAIGWSVALLPGGAAEAGAAAGQRGRGVQFVLSRAQSEGST